MRIHSPNVLVFFASCSLLSLVACSKVDEPQKTSFTPAVVVQKLEIVDEVVGTGREAKSGDKVKVHYTGTLTNGDKFDSSRDKGDPFAFTLGQGEVIKGWDDGVVGMKVGGKRKLTIPSDLGYGDQGSPPKIPPGATLKFDVELLGIE
jgi:FKBP-type peptidyl-prolyl cis-trans isomerase